MILIYKGKEIERRNANSKHEHIRNIDEILKMLETDCMAEVARKMKVPANCIRYLLYCKDDCGNFIVDREDLVRVKRARAFHKNSKRK